MLQAMLTSIDYLQVLQPVVVLDSVLVVDVLARGKSPAAVLLHDPAVFTQASAIALNIAVSLGLRHSRAAVGEVRASLGAKESRFPLPI